MIILQQAQVLEQLMWCGMNCKCVKTVSNSLCPNHDCITYLFLPSTSDGFILMIPRNMLVMLQVKIKHGIIHSVAKE